MRFLKIKNYEKIFLMSFLSTLVPNLLIISFGKDKYISFIICLILILVFFLKFRQDDIIKKLKEK